MSVKFDKALYLTSEPAKIEVRLFDGGEPQYDEHITGGTPITDATVQYVVTNPLGDTSPNAIDFVNAGNGLYTATFNAAGVGSYKFKIVSFKVNQTNLNVVDFYREKENSIYFEGSEYSTPTAHEKILEAKAILLKYANDPNKKLQKTVKTALSYLEAGLKDKYWFDENHLTKLGSEAYQSFKVVASQVLIIYNTPGYEKDFINLLENLFTFANMIASISIDEATNLCSNSVCQAKIDSAKFYFNKATKVDYLAGKYDVAIAHYKLAWEFAQKAMGVLPKESGDESNLMISSLPTEYIIEQNYPNPFNPTTDIQFQIPEDAHVTITIYNTLGQLVKTLVDDIKPAGYYNVHWDGTDNYNVKLSSGVYLYRFSTEKYSKVMKMVIMK